MNVESHVGRGVAYRTLEDLRGKWMMREHTLGHDFKYKEKHAVEKCRLELEDVINKLMDPTFFAEDL